MGGGGGQGIACTCIYVGVSAALFFRVMAFGTTACFGWLLRMHLGSRVPECVASEAEIDLAKRSRVCKFRGCGSWSEVHGLYLMLQAIDSITSA